MSRRTVVCLSVLLLVLACPNALAIKGVVIGSDGRPVAGAVVTAAPAGPGEDDGIIVRWGQTTGEDGSFAFGVPDPPWIVSASAPGLGAAEPRDVAFEEWEGLLLCLGCRGARVSGRLLSPEGEPFSGLLVSSTTPPAPGEDRWIVRLDDVALGDEGHFTVTGLPPGPQRLHLQPVGHAGVHVALELVDGETRHLGELSLPTRRVVTGRVVGPGGAGIAAARVDVQIGNASARTETAEDGGFSVAGLPDDGAPRSVKVDAPDWWPAESTDFDPAQPITVVLEPACAVIGKVVAAADDQFLPSFSVTSVPRVYAYENKFIDKRSVTREFHDGRFALSRLDRVIWDLEVQAEGFVPVRIEGVDLATGTCRVDLGKIALERGVTLVGKVVEEETGAGVAGATVKLIRPGAPIRWLRDAPAPEATSAPDGSFRLPAIGPGIRRLRAAAPGLSAAAVELRLLPTETERFVRFELAPPGAVEGTVLDGAGRPRAGVEVRVTAAGMFEDLSTTTDAAGRYRFERVEAGIKSVEVDPPQAEDDGRSPAQVIQSQQVEVRARETATADFPVPEDRGFVVQGTVRWRGRPIAADLLFLRGDPAHEVESKSMTSSDDGRFEVRLERPGRYLVKVDSGPIVQQVHVIERGAPLDIVLPDTRLSGTVVSGADGRGIPATVVAFWRPQGQRDDEWAMVDTAYTDEEGHFDLSHLPPGHVQVAAVSAKGAGATTGAPARLYEEDAISGFELVLDPSPALRVRVEDRNAEPVNGAVIRVLFVSGPLPPHSLLGSAWSKSHGRAELVSLPRPPFVITAAAPGMAPVIEEWNAGLFAADAPEVLLRAGDEGTLAVQVLGSTDQPVPGADVQVRLASGQDISSLLLTADESLREMTTGADGKLAIERVPPGRYRVQVHHRGRTEEEQVTVKADAVVEVEVEFDWAGQRRWRESGAIAADPP
jgi:hypothetical protein